MWHFVTFCDISKCHNVTILNFVTFLGFCHTVCIFEFFLAKPKMSKKHRNVTNVTNVTNQQPLQGSFQTFRKFLSFETSFCCCLARTNLESWYWLSLRSRFEIRLGTTLPIFNFLMYVSFIGLRLTKTSPALINHTRLRTKGQSAGYPQAQIGITSNSFQRRAP